MDISILNTDFEYVGVVDDYISIIWTDRYRECGDFELYMSASERAFSLFKQDYYLQIPHSNRTMIIEEMTTEVDSEDGNKLIIKGRSLESILDRRIIWTVTTIKGNVQNGIKKLINDAIISPSNPDRKIENFKFVASTDEQITNLSIAASQYTGDTLLDVIENICFQQKIGFKVVLNDTNEFEFSLFKGVDRSYDQTENPYILFSADFENIMNSRYLESKRNYKNVTLVAGEGEGFNRITTTVGSAKGLSRRELYTDARDISSSTDEGTVTLDVYLKMLKQRGKEKLAERVAAYTFDGEVDTNATMYTYGIDFDIGDVVVFEDEYGNAGTEYVSEFIISEDENGIAIYPSFSAYVQYEEE